jgi:hypothetical protein
MCSYRSKWDFSPNTTCFKFSPFPGLSEPAPMTPILFWMEGNSSTNFGLANHLQQFHFGWVLKETSPFFWPFFFQTRFTNYQPHSRTHNPSSPSYIFGEPNILVSSVSKNNAHNPIPSTIACSNMSSIVSHHKFHGSQFDNNSHVKFAFHRFIWNRHKCHSSTSTIWTSMSCALFRHKCHMHVHIVWTRILCVYLYCLHTKVVCTTFMFK